MAHMYLRSGISVALLFLAAQSFAEDKVRTGKSSRETIDRLYVYKLKGDAYEIGRASAVLMPKAALKDGMFPYLADYVENMLYDTPMLKKAPLLKPLVPAFLNLKYYNKINSSMPKEELETMRGYAHVTGASMSDLKKAITNPDVGHVLVSDYMQDKILPFEAKGEFKKFVKVGPSPWGCSSFIAMPEETSSKRLIVARAQDYAGVGVFDQFPAVFYVDKPGKYKYVSIMTAGPALGVVTAMNEHGLVVALHSALSYDVNINGRPMLTLNRQIMEEAKTIDEAVAMCNATPPASGWMVNLADVVDGKPRAARMEINAREKKCLVTYTKDYSILTNHYLHDDTRKTEIKFGPSFDGHNTDRYERMTELLEDQSGKIDIESSMSILADRKDLRTGRFMSYPPSGVAAIDQVVSVVFLPETREMYVSDGLSPTASQGQYVHMNFDDLRKEDDDWKKDDNKDMSAESVIRGTDNDLSRWPAYQFVKQASIDLDFMRGNDGKKALISMNKAVNAEPEEPMFHLYRAALQMRLERPAQAIPDLKMAAASDLLDDHRRHVAEFLIGKAYDSLGRRAEAQAVYQRIASDKDVYQKIRDAAQKFNEEPFDRSELKYMDMSIKFFDFISYD